MATSFTTIFFGGSAVFASAPTTCSEILAAVGVVGDALTSNAAATVVARVSRAAGIALATAGFTGAEETAPSAHQPVITGATGAAGVIDAATISGCSIAVTVHPSHVAVAVTVPGGASRGVTVAVPASVTVT